MAIDPKSVGRALQNTRGKPLRAANNYSQIAGGTWARSVATQSAAESRRAGKLVVKAKQRHPAALADSTPAIASSTTRQSAGRSPNR